MIVCLAILWLQANGFGKVCNRRIVFAPQSISESPVKVRNGRLGIYTNGFAKIIDGHIVIVCLEVMKSLSNIDIGIVYYGLLWDRRNSRKSEAIVPSYRYGVLDQFCCPLSDADTPAKGSR